jgi:hypothetical protein
MQNYVLRDPFILALTATDHLRHRLSSIDLRLAAGNTSLGRLRQGCTLEITGMKCTLASVLTANIEAPDQKTIQKRRTSHNK